MTTTTTMKQPGLMGPSSEDSTTVLRSKCPGLKLQHIEDHFRRRHVFLSHFWTR